MIQQDSTIVNQKQHYIVFTQVLLVQLRGRSDHL